MLTALMLYGSRARGDFNASSDVDLLGVSPTLPSHLVSEGNIKLNIYHQDVLLNMAVDGSLYVWHLKCEGKTIFDHEQSLNNILSSFVLKKDYSKKRYEAAMTGWLLFSPGVLDSQNELIVSTVVYVVRTIAYSILAEKNTPAFSLRDVMLHISDDNLKKLWLIKHKSSMRNAELERFGNFMLRYAGPAPHWAGMSLTDIPPDGLTSFARRRCKEIMTSISTLADAPPPQDVGGDEHKFSDYDIGIDDRG
jgi:predicted nucleotidyltransferase